MTIEQRPVATGQQTEQQAGQSEVYEPKTFSERVDFIKRIEKLYLEEKISWESQWYYEQKYGVGAPGEKTI